MNPSYLHGAYCCYDEDDRTLKIVFMSEELNILHLSSKKIDLSPSLFYIHFSHTYTHKPPFLTHFYLPPSKLAEAKAPKSVASQCEAAGEH